MERIAQTTPSRKRGKFLRLVDRSEFFTRNGAFIPPRLGARLMKEASIRLGNDHRLWRYVGGVYRPDGEEWARHRTRVVLGERFRKRHVEEVIAYLGSQLPSLGQEPVTQFINCTNGLLDWQTGTLHPHSSDVLSTNQIPVAWKPSAVAPVFGRFIREVLPADAIEFIGEVIGYALYAGNPFRKAVLFLGPGANGKSVLLRVLRWLLGDTNVSAVPLQSLSEDRFAAAQLFGKLVNICGDLDARAIRRSDMIKQITGGDPIFAQNKFRDAFSFVSYALTLFSANEAPATTDQTKAWFDRWIIIAMERCFEGKDADPHLSEKLKAELEGILVLAVAGLRRLMERGGFVYPASVEQARQQYRHTFDSVEAFITEECHFEPDAWIDRATLYSRYKKYCHNETRFALTATAFNKHVAQAFGLRVTLTKRRGRPGWSGLGVGVEVVRECPHCGKETIQRRGAGNCPKCGTHHGATWLHFLVNSRYA